MAEVTYKSPGVFTTEIDLSQPTVGQPIGVPAGVIGTAQRGPAFVPITVADMRSFVSVFGDTDGKKFGPLAVNEYLKNARALTYMRVLGAGDGKRRNGVTGKVNRAGFVVGNRQVQDNGVVGANTKASSTANEMGRTYFLGAFMSESAGSTYFSDAGIQIKGENLAAPILRGVLMTPSGVIATLSGNFYANGSDKPGGSTTFNQDSGINGAIANIQGGITGSVNAASQQFVLLLNGHKPTSDSPNVYTASFDIQSGYFGNILNTDPSLIREKGHVLYARYDIDGSLATVTGSGIIDPAFHAGRGKDQENLAFLTTGSGPRNAADTYVPNYESFEDRFTTSKSPFLTSQKYGTSPYDLFRVVSLDDGQAPAADRFKIEIVNIVPKENDYGSFSLNIRRAADNDLEPRFMEKHSGLTLDPSSPKYIARVIGDKLAYFDFDQADSSQKLVVKGNHAVQSAFIRVEMSEALEAGEVPIDALPVGFRGPAHLITSGSHPLTDIVGEGTGDHGIAGDVTEILKRTTEPPVPYRTNLKFGAAPNITAKAALNWGVRFDLQRTLGSKLNVPLLPDVSFPMGFERYFPSFDPSNFNFLVENNPGVADQQGTVLDCDKFNNNAFSLENIMVRTGSDSNRRADPDQWASASYVRNGNIGVNPTNKTRAWKVSDLLMQGNRNYSNFTVLMQGGFNGTNIFDDDQAALTNTSAKREMDDSISQGGVEGPTVAAFRQALDIMGTKADVDIQLLTIPGMRHSSITDYAIDVVESRFDALYIMDLEERDGFNQVVTGALGELESVNVNYTVEAFKGRALNTSFAASYFPDVVIQDPKTKTNVDVPPSVVVLGAFAQNDSIGYSWFAPAGFTRGTLNDTLFSKVPLVKDNMDNLYDADINPITSFPGTGLMVFGQKTLLADASALDRVNVRRLLIEIRRRVKSVANLMLFEPNRQETLDKFNSLVQPIMQQIQERSGVDRFKVVIDSTTTTQTDIENNTLRGKIFLQPTRTAEFVSLDFVVSNAGEAFENA